MMPPTDAELSDLYTRYAHVLHHRARRILGNEEDARDAVQETFAKVLVNYERFRNESSPLTWMYTISTNLCLNRLRDRSGRARKLVEHRDQVVGDGFSIGEAGSWERGETVRRLLHEEEDTEVKAIVLHIFFDDMTREEAARAVGVSVPTLRKRLRGFLERARRSMSIPQKAGLAAGATLTFCLLLSTLALMVLP